MKFTNPKVLNTSKGLHSIHGIFRYFPTANQITLNASFLQCFFFHNIYTFINYLHK